MTDEPAPAISALSAIAQEIGAIRRLPQGNVPDWLWKSLADWHRNACASLDKARAERV